MPSIEDEEERHADETTPSLQKTDPDLPEEVDVPEENPTDTTALTTTVNLFDNDQIVTSPPIQQDNEQGKADEHEAKEKQFSIDWFP